MTTNDISFMNETELLDKIEKPETSNDVLDDLFQNGVLYHVWQAVWLCEQITKSKFPERKDFQFDQTGLRFQPYENYVYPPKDIRAILSDNDEIVFILNFLGLYGINSPLPRCYHEQVSFQLRILGHNNVPLQTFYDMFNNRFYWLYYQSWKKYRFHLFIDSQLNNNIAQRIFSFTGKEKKSHSYSNLNDFALLKFSGIFSQRVRNKTSLKILLAYFFPGFSMKIKEFIPRWIDLSDIPALGNSETKLGLNTFIGSTIIDYTSKICIEINNISYTNYLGFLPGTFNCKKLFELLKLFVNDGLEFDMNFHIDTETIIAIDLSDENLHLGTTLWLGKPQQEDVDVYVTYDELAQAA